MKNFIFIITFLISNTAFAAPSYDATVKWLIEKIPVAGSFEDDSDNRVFYKLDLKVSGNKFILKHRFEKK